MNKINFCAHWTVFHEDTPENSVSVTLPYDAMIHEQRDPDSCHKNANGYFPGGVYHYQKKFIPDQSWKDQSVLLEFEGVYHNSTVTLNLEKLCFHPNGYTGFQLDLTEKLLWDKENTLEVVVDTTLPNSRWYAGSGIYRPVWLYVGNRCHIQPGKVSVQTLALHPAVLRIRTEIADSQPEDTLVRVEILDGNQTVATGEGTDIKLTIPDAKLWSSESPDLYRCHVSLYSKGQLTDETTISCGICKLEWSTEGLFVNGRETILRGACIHHDNGILGACDYPAASFRKVKILKEAGFNAIRSSHNPISVSLLEACDQLGMYVMDEFTDMWYAKKSKNDYSVYFSSHHTEDLTAMIQKDISHPCVILYSIGNEVTETCEVPGIALTKEMTDLIHQLDPSRPVTCGINMTLNVMHFAGMDLFHTGEEPADPPEKTPKGYAHLEELKAMQSASKTSSAKPTEDMSSSEYFNQMMSNTGNRMWQVCTSAIAGAVSEDAYAALDIAGYNYGDGRYYLDKLEYPDRISVGSETLPQDIVNNWKAVRQLPYLIGDFLWTGWDYLGEARIGAFCYESSGCNDKEYPALLAGCGVIDITGMHRPEIMLNKIAYGIEKGPFVSVAPVTHSLEDVKCSAWRQFDSIRSWSWTGCEGRPAKLVIYADAAKVDLLLNDTLIGSVIPENYTAVLETVYVPGTLTAIAYDADGNETGRDLLTTAGSSDRLTVIPSSGTLHAGGQDLCFLDIRLTDEHGIVKASEDRAFSVEVTGAASLAGIGNADPFSTLPYIGTSHQTYYGRGQAVLRSKEEAGTAQITVRMDGCEPVYFNLPVEK